MTSSRMFNRRDFIRNTALTTGGLFIAFTVPSLGKKRRLLSEENQSAKDEPLSPNAFLHIGTDDSVNVILSHCEMGQGISTSLCMLIAEELDADWSKIRAEHAPAAVIYYHTIYGTQRTGGSTSLLSEFDRYRKAGATARYMLIQAAANRLQVDPKDCTTDNGYVISGDKKLSYGQLAEDAAKVPVPADVTLKDAANWKYIGKTNVKRLDTAAKINGEAIFGMDIHFPGMLTAVVARGPVPGAKVKTYNATATLAVPGVKQVVTVPSGVAVLADNFWAAKKGREALKVDWELGPAANINSDALYKEFRQLADKGGLPATDKGNVDAALQKANQVLDIEYFQPFLAHAPMEPLNCTVKLSADKCEIWTGTQTVTDDHHAAAEITGLPIDKVVINTVFLGGSFGRRNITRSDFVREGVEVAKASGKFVKTVWTREDDIQGGMYRPAFLHRFKIGLDKNGMPLAWKQISVGQSVMTGGPFEKLAVINGVDQFSIENMHTAAYVKGIPDQHIAVNTPVWPITIDNWRAVGLSHTIFAMESLVDEMAHAVKQDPVAYRRMLYKDAPRLLKVLELAAAKSNWGQPLPPGHGRGIAVSEAVGSFAAVVAEIEVTGGWLKVNKVTCAIDCGIAISPDGILAQMDSNILYGLSTTLYSEITFKNGRPQQKNFMDYKSMRMGETPVIETYIAPSEEKPGGIGEAAVGQIMPAVTNAIFAATGQRIRSLPIVKHTLTEKGNGVKTEPLGA